jgi:hypothetical protein
MSAFDPKRTLLSTTGMSALCQKRALMGFTVRWRTFWSSTGTMSHSELAFADVTVHFERYFGCRCWPLNDYAKF